MAKDVHVNDSIPAYALECLDEAEADAVSEHLKDCSLCRAELRAYRAVAELLAHTAALADPPLHVKAALMDRVRASMPAQPASEADSSWLARIRQFFLSTSLKRLAPAWGALSLILILVLATSNALLWYQVNQLRASSEQTPMQVVTLLGTEIVPQASGLIVISRDGRHGTLVVDDLPALDESREYQLWLIRDGQRISGGVFSVSPDGYANQWIGAPEPLTDYSAFGVTIEPAGGSLGPTGDKVLGGEF